MSRLFCWCLSSCFSTLFWTVHTHWFFNHVGLSCQSCRFFYYGTGTTLFRVDLSSVQINTVTCPSSIGGASAIGSFDTLYGFTIEQDEAIYILAQDLQACGVNGRTLSLNLGGQNNTLFSYSSSLLFTRAHLDSFTQYIVVGVDSRIIYVPTVTVNAGCGIQGVIVRDTPRTVSLIRMFRSSQQPTPGTYEQNECTTYTISSPQ